VQNVALAVIGMDVLDPNQRLWGRLAHVLR
jgi:hypothetical protein